MIFDYPPNAPHATAIDPTKAPSWRILLVDDDEDDYLITRSHLQDSPNRKIHLEWANSFDEGLKRLRDQEFDAVLVDYDLGRETGIQLIRQAVGEKVHAPLILYTGRGGRHVDLEAMEVGATLYLTKSETNPLLLERSIRYAIERKQTERDLRASHERYRRLFLQLEDLVQARLSELARAKELFEQLFQAAPDATLLVRTDGRIRRLNSAVEHMFGYTVDELLGRSVEMLVPERLRPVHTLERINYLAGPDTRRMGEKADILALNKNGEEFPVDVMLSPVLIDGEMHIICMMREVHP